MAAYCYANVARRRSHEESTWPERAELDHILFSSFDDFLKEEGTAEKVTARAIKRVIVRQLDTDVA